jgi:hypothetical protein
MYMSLARWNHAPTLDHTKQNVFEFTSEAEFLPAWASSQNVCTIILFSVSILHFEYSTIISW